MGIPAFHDDQHGTAIISGAALLNALELVEKKIDQVRVVFNGAGAAGGVRKSIRVAGWAAGVGVEAPARISHRGEAGVLEGGRAEAGGRVAGGAGASGVAPVNE